MGQDNVNVILKQVSSNTKQIVYEIILMAYIVQGGLKCALLAFVASKRYTVYCDTVRYAKRIYLTL